MISVIVPVYKVEPYLRRCIDSILCQTYRDFELILVDDGSPDNCGAICDEYATKDSRVVVIHQENGGLSAARNAGIDASKGEYLSFVDSDDWIHPEMLQWLLRAIQSNHVPISVCGFQETDGRTVAIAATDFAAQMLDTEQFFVSYNVNATIACGKLYARELFAGIRYPVGKIHEDEFTTYKILFTQEKIAFFPAQMYFYFRNYDGITKSTWKLDRMDSLEANCAQIEFFAKYGYKWAYKYESRLLSKRIIEHYNMCNASGLMDRKRKKMFSAYARQFLRCYLKGSELDQERKVHLLWIAFPAVSKVYHRLKGVKF